MAGGFKYTMLVPLVVGLIIKNSVDTGNEENVLWARRFFLFGKIIEMIIYGMLYFRITSKPNDKTVVVSERDMQPPNPLANMLGLDEEEEEENSKETLTYTQYDLRVLIAEFKQTVIQSCIVTVIHVQWGYLIPMVIPVLTALVNKSDNALFRIHMLGHPPQPELKRPFKKKSAFGGLMPQRKPKKKKEKGRNGKKKGRKAN
eukprot:CAMPEP_0114513218 /NCGR_PEP_ID=MMETSP0109-20121206/15435_1 /TAXON_ID=29199 /ORGANISM="Chlorarachnion reptans, Strain CCCM449" /LENGTH=201 /DNA_ID=CAMNT_0001693041 /DNA_START=55 /DNA_END=660 /DNA_ORIENTATION=+